MNILLTAYWNYLFQSFMLPVERHLIDTNSLRSVTSLVQNRTTQIPFHVQAVQIRQSAQFIAFRWTHWMQFQLTLRRVLQKSRNFLVGRRYYRIARFIVDVATTSANLTSVQVAVLHALSVVFLCLVRQVLKTSVQYGL